MNLKEILSISGQSGLYKYVAQGKGGIIVEALDASARRQMVSGSAKVSSLGDIAVFTDEKEVPLAELFTAIYKKHNGAVGLTSKATPDELAAFMAGVLPKYDRERVHNSDIKKLASWYNTLVAAGVTTFADEEEAAAEAKPAAAEKAAAKAPRKPTAAAAKAPKAPKGAASSKSKVTATKSTTARKAQ